MKRCQQLAECCQLSVKCSPRYDNVDKCNISISIYYLLFTCKDRRRYSRERARSRSIKYQVYLYFLCWAQAAVPVEAEAEELAHVREDAVHDVREAPTVDFGSKRARAGVGAKP